MTKKQYEKKMRQLNRNLKKYAKENGYYKPFKEDQINTPSFGVVIGIGKHHGEILRTYQQAWDLVSEVLRGTPVMDGIE